MKRTTSIAGIAALVLSLLSPICFAALPAPGDSGELDVVAYEAIVELRPGATITNAMAAIPGLEIKSQSPHFTVVRLVPAGASLLQAPEVLAATMQLVERLRGRKDIESVQPNYRFKLAHTPNDPLYHLQWHYPAINLPQAWDITRGNSSIKIAILDTGKTSHPDLAGKWMPVEFNGQSPGQPANDESNFRHGTHVAAIAAAASNDGFGTAGVCHGCRLLNARIVDSFNSPITEYVAAGIHWAIDNGARVINMSFEFKMPCTEANMPSLRKALARANASGIVLVAAAGNGGFDVAGVKNGTVSLYVDNYSPASCPNVISVGALDRDLQLASYSNRGLNIGIMAPGGGWDPNIHPQYTVRGRGIGCPDDPDEFYPFEFGAVSAWTSRPSNGNVNCHRYLTGTSMSAPHVSGTVGLMLSVKPQLNPVDVKAILQRTARRHPYCFHLCGPGMLDAHASVVAARDWTGP